jgi:hypothetical protein
VKRLLLAVFGLALTLPPAALAASGSTESEDKGAFISEEWDRRSRRLLGLIGALCVAALCVSPVGPHLLFYPLDTLFHQSTGTNAMEEWLPPDMRSVRAMGMLGLLAVVFLLSLVRGSQLTVRELLLIATVSLLAFRYTRMLFVYGIVMAPVLCRCFRSDWRDEEQQAHPFVNAALMAVSLAVIVWAFPSAASLDRQVGQSSPVKAAEYIRRAGLTGPMLNQYDFGGYLIWALPEEKVFVDGRADVYDWAGVLAEYGNWATLQADPLVLLNKHGIRLCVLSRTAPIATAMRYLPGWREAYSDEVAVVFVRNDHAASPAHATASVHEFSPAPLD